MTASWHSHRRDRPGHRGFGGGNGLATGIKRGQRRRFKVGDRRMCRKRGTDVNDPYGGRKTALTAGKPP
ncbi:hypothetical protein R6Q59_003880 [Mikania micrantha]